jgi:hypothetical protein
MVSDDGFVALLPASLLCVYMYPGCEYSCTAVRDGALVALEYSVNLGSDVSDGVMSNGTGVGCHGSWASQSVEDGVKRSRVLRGIRRKYL